jgi:iron complex outermembrane receptor protein
MNSKQRSRVLMNGSAFVLAGSLVLGMAPAAFAAADAAADAGHVDDVVVTARKRSENVQDVPVPVTTISAQTLERQNLTTFMSFQYKFPSFSVYITNPKQLNLGIRGLGNNGFNTDGVDGSVGIFVDGVYTGRQGMVSTDFNDIADVELLRGPQGTLFGKNTTAGAVIINTLRPSFTFGGSAEATVGSENLRQAKASVTGPLLGDKLAGRLSAYWNEKDGNYENIYAGGEDANARQGQGIRGQLLANLTDNLQARVILSHNEQHFNTAGPVILSVYTPTALQARMAAAGYTLLASNFKDRQINIDSPLNASTHSNVASLQLDWDLGDRGAVTSISAYQNWTCFTNNDNDYTQLNALKDYGSCNDEHQYSQELRWASVKDRPVEAVVGGFLSRQTLNVGSRLHFGNQYYIWAANPNATQFPNIGARTWAQGAYADAVAGVGFRSDAVFGTDTNAIFGNAVWHPMEDRKLAVEFGLRQTWEDRDYSYFGQVVSNTANLTQAQINALSPSAANAQLGTGAASAKDKSLSGTVGVNYNFTPAVMAYATYARGHKSKGFNLLPYNSTNPDTGIGTAIGLGAKQNVDGESADNVEIGLKSEWFDRRLLINITAFDTKVKNYQANQAIGVGNAATRFLANVGSVSSKGVETEGELALGDLRFKGLIAYNKAIYSSFHNSVCPAQTTALVCDLTGRQVAWAPKWTASLTATYSKSLFEGTTSYIIAETNWRSEQNTTITLDPAANIDAYGLASLRIGTTFLNDALDFQIWSENILNKAYYINLLGLTKATGIVQGYPGNPRSFGATLRYKF